MAWMWPLAGFMTARQCCRSESFALVPGPEHQVRAVCSNPSDWQPHLPGCQAEDKLGCSLLRHEHWGLACLWVGGVGWVGWALGLEASPGNHSCGLRQGHSEVPRSSKVRTSLEIVVYLLNRTCRCHLSRATPPPPMYLESDVEATRDPPHPGICSSAGMHEAKMDTTLNNFRRRDTLGREGWAPCPEAAAFYLSVTHGPCHYSDFQTVSRVTNKDWAIRETWHWGLWDPSVSQRFVCLTLGPKCQPSKNGL